jgi:RNA polymerase sigma factor (sigma-70 family)
MDCKELDEPDLITLIFREKIKREVDRLFSCFYERYYEKFTRIVQGNISNKYRFLKDDPEFYSSLAFSEGLLTFQQYMARQGFVKGQAKLSSFFFRFCINKLLAQVANRIREQPKLAKFIKDTKEDWMPHVEENDMLDNDERLLWEAINMLDEKKKQYIILRKFYKYKDDEIAKITGVAPQSVANEVYRAFLRLKENCQSLKGIK